MISQIEKKIKRNTIFNIIGYIWRAGVSFFLTPYIIHHIGGEKFGIWMIAGIITGYFGLLDLGVAFTLVKYIAEFYAKKEYDEINKIISAGILFLLLFSITICIVGFSLINYIIKFFKISEIYIGDAILALKIGFICFGIGNLTSIFSAIHGGLQRMDISNKIAIGVSIPNIIGTIYFLEKGYGFTGLILNTLIIAVINFIVNIITAYKVYPELKFNKIEKKTFKKIFTFGINIKIVGIFSYINTTIDKLLIGRFLSPIFVTFCELGERLVFSLHQIFAVISSAFMPAASEIDATYGKEKVYEFYVKSSRNFNFWVFPSIVFLFLIANNFMLAWMGEGYKYSVWVIRILIIGIAANLSLTAISSHIALGINKPQMCAKAASVTGISNLFFSIILIIKYGFFGTIMGTTIANLLGSLSLLLLLNRYFNKSIKLYLKESIYIPLLVNVISGTITYLILKLTNLLNISISRWLNLLIIVLGGTIFLSIYLIVKKIKWGSGLSIIKK